MNTAPHIKPAVRRVLACLALSFSAAATQAQSLRAEYTVPTSSYAHGVLGDAIEYKSMRITTPEKQLKLTLPAARVFEDIAPRLWDVTGDGTPEIVVIETDPAQGAQLAVYDAHGRKRAATPHIGQTHRWLAPVGAADYDGDGHIEIAYIDRPHLAKTLRVWRFENDTLTEAASLKGLTNHRIGWDYILSGTRDCGNGPEMITANADWTRIMSTRLTVKGLATSSLAPYTGRQSIIAALNCKL